MRLFCKFYKINAMEQMKYKSAFISGILCQIAFGFMMIILYGAFYEAGVPNDFNYVQMASYVWLGQAFFSMFNYGDNNKKFISQKIVSGNVAYSLLKPISLYDYWFYHTFTNNLCLAMVRFWPILIIGFILPEGIGLSLPTSIESCLLFILALILGAIVMTAIKMICYLIVLYTLDPRGVFNIIYGVCGLLGGLIIPIPLMPNVIQKILNFFPFRYTGDLAYRIYIGNVGVVEALPFIAIQIVWIIGLIAIGKILINKKCKKLVVQGG